MKRLIPGTAILMLLAMAGPLLAASPDAQTRADAVAPLVEDDTVIVVHADLSRISPQPLLDLLYDVSGAITRIEGWDDYAKALLQIGVKDAYAILPPKILFTRHPQMVLAIPMGSAVQEATIRTSLSLTGNAGRKVDNLLALGIGCNVPTEFRPVARLELATAFEAVGDAAAQVAVILPAGTDRVLEQLLPQLPDQLGGGSSDVVARGVRWAAIGIDPAPKPRVRLVVQSENAEAAAALAARLGELAPRIAQSEEARTQIPDLDAVVSFLAAKVDGSRLILESDKDVATFGRALAVLTRPLKQSEAIINVTDDLKSIGLGLMNYEQAKHEFPMPAIRSADGKPLLSWRVAILPHLGLNRLYREFHLDEPWDSPHNRALVDKMPDVYRMPLSKAERGSTHYLLPAGNGAAFDLDKPTTFKDITDGSSSTIMVVEVDDGHAVPWTKPEDWPFDPANPTRGLGHFFDNGFWVTICDGSARWFELPSDPKGIERLRAMFTRAGGEVVDW